MGTIAEQLAWSCFDNYGLEVRVLREKGSGKLLGTGSCCNTENKVLSASVCGQSVRSASHLRATMRYARLRLKPTSDRQVSA